MCFSPNLSWPDLLEVSGWSVSLGESSSLLLDPAGQGELDLRVTRGRRHMPASTTSHLEIGGLDTLNHLSGDVLLPDAGILDLECLPLLFLSLTTAKRRSLSVPGLDTCSCTQAYHGQDYSSPYPSGNVRSWGSPPPAPSSTHCAWCWWSCPRWTGLPASLLHKKIEPQG